MSEVTAYHERVVQCDETRTFINAMFVSSERPFPDLRAGIISISGVVFVSNSTGKNSLPLIERDLLTEFSVALCQKFQFDDESRLTIILEQTRGFPA
jgi:molybdate-binding protein